MLLTVTVICLLYMAIIDSDDQNANENQMGIWQTINISKN